MLGAFIKDPPDYIVITHMDTTEDGHRFFGAGLRFYVKRVGKGKLQF